MSLLTSLSKAKVQLEPFPHLIVEDCLQQPLCDRLTENFPAIESFVKGRALPPNKKIVRRATELLADMGLASLWKSFIEEHLAPVVFSEWLALLGDTLLAEYPQFADPTMMNVGVRGQTDSSIHHVALDAALVAHTPNPDMPGQERGPHIKEPNKPFLGFLFLRSSDDTAEGGELIFYRTQSDAVKLTGRNEVAEEDVVEVKRVPYASNTLLLMLNTPRTITTHAARSPSSNPMQYFHLLAELTAPLFPLNMQK
jgi:hypothetical protein